jgi:hypothetical protein
LHAMSRSRAASRWLAGSAVLYIFRPIRFRPMFGPRLFYLQPTLDPGSSVPEYGAFAGAHLSIPGGPRMLAESGGAIQPT